MYDRQYWKNHVTQYEDRFKEQTNPDGSITHIPVEGEVVQEGTPQNATNFNNLETGVFSAHEIGSEVARQLLQQKRRLNMIEGETGAVTLANTLVYPFNNSMQSVTIAAVRDRTDYTVEIDTGASNPQKGDVVVFDKLKNGFKMAFTGGAASVAVNYTIRGGIF
ncbi:hypothetical protein FACS1894111_05590 [Clostridia bacterium]|nr:hypothetical protein FACS1894111_05590 [Clostridia bacterium]